MRRLPGNGENTNSVTDKLTMSATLCMVVQIAITLSNPVREDRKSPRGEFQVNMM